MFYILLVLAASFVGAAQAGEADSIPPIPVKQSDALGPRGDDHATYRKKYAAYKQAYGRYEKKASAYWDLISEKRKERRAKLAKGRTADLDDYVLEQPPVYSGPPEPPRPPSLRDKPRAGKRDRLPVVADFLRHAETRFKFWPEPPASEMDFKRAYAREALEAGLSREQAVRIYGFEASGNGLYDVQAGLESGRKKGRAISTALGYNQLLTANTIGLLSEHGDKFVEKLQDMAANAKGERLKALEWKIKKLRQMIRASRSVPYEWNKHVSFGRTAKGLALHSLNLDIDIGPMLQTQKLLNSVNYLRRKGFKGRFTAAELEMMNLMGDGSGYEVVSMPAEMRDKVPTSNFFLRRGYERNPVVQKNNVVSELLAATDRKMDYQAALDGAKDLDAAFREIATEKSASN